MARGRMIDKRVGMSKKLGKASDKARTLWFMIYPHLDREGRIAFEDLEDLKDEILPKFKDWKLKKIGDALNELADIRLIKLYPNGDDIAIQYNKFEDFQIGLRKEREADSKVSPPGVAPESSGVFQISPALRLNKVKVNEGKKEENNNSFNDEEKLILKELKGIKNFSRDKEKIINYIRKLKEEFPKADPIEVIRALYSFFLKTPITKRSNPFARMRNFFRNQHRWTEEGDQQRRVGQSKKEATSLIDAKIMHEVYELCKEKGIDISEFYDKAKKVFPIIKTTWEQSDKKPATFVRLVEEA